MPTATRNTSRIRMRRRVDELLRLACIFAESDRRSFSACNAKGTPEHKEALELANEIYAYRMKRWGATQFESDLKECYLIDARTGKRVER